MIPPRGNVTLPDPAPQVGPRRTWRCALSRFAQWACFGLTVVAAGCCGPDPVAPEPSAAAGLSRPANLNAVPSSEVRIATAGDGAPIGETYLVLPEGLAFALPAVVTLAFRPEALPKDADPVVATAPHGATG